MTDEAPAFEPGESDDSDPPLVRLVWLTLLVKAHSTTGVVDADAADIAAFVTRKGDPAVTPDEVQDAIRRLGRDRVWLLDDGRHFVPRIREYFPRRIAAASEGSHGSTQKGT